MTTPSQPLHPNVQFVIDAHETLERGDMAAIAATFCDDIVWHEFGGAPLAGDYRGREAVFAFWKRYFAAAGEGFGQDIVAIMGNDEFVSTIVLLTGRKGERALRQEAVDVMRMRDGRIAEFWRYYADLGEAHTFMNA